jgi:hypothetical protein
VVHPLDGAQAKLLRANEHLDRLERDSWEFLESEPYRFVGKREAHEYVIRLQVLAEPPISLAVTVGDVLFDLRSALDHLVWQLALLKQKPPVGTEFPIFKDEGKFLRTGRGGGLYKVRGLLPEHQTIIQSLQPYTRGEDAMSDPLWVLHELTNADKHRTLNMGMSMAEEIGFNFSFSDLVIKQPIEIIAGPFVDNAVVARVFTVETGPHPKMAVKPHAMFNITFDEGGLFGGQQIPNLLELRDAAVATVERFMREIA